MPNVSQKLSWWTTVLDDRPADQVRTPSEQHDDPRRVRRARLHAAVDHVTPRAVRLERSGRSHETAGATGAQSFGFAPAPWIRSGPAAKRSIRKRRTRFGQLRDVDRPHRPANPLEVRGIGDLLVAKELRPGTGGSVGEVVRRTTSGLVPSPRRLGGALPHEGPARVRVAEDDHVAGEPASEEASSRTRFGPSSSGVQWRASRAAGFLPPSADRGRANHRRMPMSL